MKLEGLIIPIRFERDLFDQSLQGIKDALDEFDVSVGEVAFLGGLGAVGAAYLGFVADAVKDTIEWREKVMEVYNLLGTTPEESSGLLFLFETLGIKISAANTAAKDLAKEGLTLDIETLGDLSEQYLAIEDAAGRQKFLLDNLGESGAQLRPIMELGREGIDLFIARMPDALQLTGDLYTETQNLKVETGLMKAEWLGFKAAISEDIIPGLSDLLGWLNDIYPVLSGIVGFLYSISAVGIGQSIGDWIGGNATNSAPSGYGPNRGGSQQSQSQQPFDYHQLASILAGEIAKINQ